MRKIWIPENFQTGSFPLIHSGFYLWCMMSGFKLYLFVPPRLKRNGEIVHIACRKATGLLAYLATTQQHHNREALATMFCPEFDQRQGLADLSWTLSVLNKALGPAWGVDW